MKQLILFLVLALSLKTNAQISLEHHYPVSNNFGVIKLHQAGYKYMMVDMPAFQIRLYNPNHSLYKTITVPNIVCTAKQVYALTDQLYNTNSLIEYGLSCINQTSSPPISITYTFYVFDENGVQLFKRDSATIVQTMTGTNPMLNLDPIYTVGTGTKLKLGIGSPALYHEIYSLPGTIPCEECVDGNLNVITSRSENEESDDKSLFFPNPVSEQLKLNYQLPKGAKEAELRIYTAEGKLLDTMRITNEFDHLLLPSEFNNGLYLYSLSVDGKVIKTEKIILSR